MNLQALLKLIAYFWALSGIGWVLKVQLFTLPFVCRFLAGDGGADVARSTNHHLG